MKAQEMGIGVEQAELSAAGCGESSPKQQTEKAVQDQDYVRSMEERYGIREEGVF
jgi:hypothetical protein